MSSLPFLSVDASADQGGFHPVARSAIDRVQRDLGATFEERGGWLVPVSIPGEEGHGAVGIADVSHLTKLELRPAGEEIAVPGGDPGVRLKPDTSRCDSGDRLQPVTRVASTSRAHSSGVLALANGSPGPAIPTTRIAGDLSIARSR